MRERKEGRKGSGVRKGEKGEAGVTAKSESVQKIEGHMQREFRRGKKSLMIKQKFWQRVC